MIKVTRPVLGKSAYTYLQHNPRTKRFVRRLVSAGLRCLPSRSSYPVRSFIERFVFKHAGSSADLPPIFHYWSNTFLLPQLQTAGYESPADFFLKEVLQRAQSSTKIVRCLSIASGRGEMEVNLARQLLQLGQRNFSIQCVDLNLQVLKAAKQMAQEGGVASHMAFAVVDLNCAKPGREQFDVLIANQCLHHVVELEAVIDYVKHSLIEDGVFLTSDVVGRNGHMLWPEVRCVVDTLWSELPDRLRYDRNSGGTARRYVDYDHSNTGFEGIRAQDILPLLVRNFDFEVALFYAGIILPFIERRFGWNYDVASAQDREVIDRIARLDIRLQAEDHVKPTQVLAKMRRKGVRHGNEIDAANALALRSIRHCA